MVIVPISFPHLQPTEGGLVASTELGIGHRGLPKLDYAPTRCLGLLGKGLKVQMGLCVFDVS